MTGDDLRAEAKAAVKRFNRHDARTDELRQLRNEALRLAVEAGVTVADLQRDTHMSRAQIERVITGRSTGNVKPPAHDTRPDTD